MSTARASKESDRRSAGLAQSQPNAFWKRVGIYPDALTKLSKKADFKIALRRTLAGIGVGNLRLLAEVSLIPFRIDATDSQLVEIILQCSDEPTLAHLREFMKRKSDAIDNQFETAFTKGKRQGYAATVAQHSRSRSESIKTFTKLILLYQKSPTLLLNIFFLDLWQGKSSYFEYAIDGPQLKQFPRRLNGSTKQLQGAFNSVTKLGIDELPSHSPVHGLTIWVFLRQYPTRVRRDFYSTYNIINDCGLIILGFDAARSTLILKSGNKQLAKALESVVRDHLSYDIKLLKNEVFSNYNPESVRHAFAGDYKDDCGVDVTAIKLNRSGLPGRGALVLEAGFMQQSLKADLQFLNEDQRLLDIHGLANIDSVTVTFRHHAAIIKFEHLPGGAVRLAFENAGWDGETQSDFEQAFLDAFGIPLNRLIDPTVASLGRVGIFSFLLQSPRADQIEGYQEECLDLLRANDFLIEESHELRGCRNNFCSEKFVPITDANRDICRKCENSLEEWSATKLKPNVSALATFVGDVLERVTGCKFDATARELETRPYFALTSQSDTDEEHTICVLFHDRLSTETRAVFERSSRPIINVAPIAIGSEAYVDFDNVGRLSSAYLIAAQADEVERDTFDRKCKAMVDKLLLTHRECIEKAARHSYEILTGGRQGIDGNLYEDLIFNLMRIIFPDSIRLGRIGKIEPDGFVAIPHFREEAESVADIGFWNFSYDAKFSDKAAGYKIGQDERRKMLEYISSFRRRKVLEGRDRKIRAHVIVSNKVAKSEMKSAAKFLFGPDGLSKSTRDVKLVLIEESFVLGLYDWLQANPDTARERRGYLNESFIEAVEADSPDRFIHLDADAAQRVIRTVLSQQPLHVKKVKRGELVTALDNTDSLLK